MVPGARIELALCYQNRILNPARLPVPPPRHAHTASETACWQAHRPKGGKYMREKPDPPHYTEFYLRPFAGCLHPSYKI